MQFVINYVQYILFFIFKVKRTSLWNKACEELRKHQEFISKVQQNSDFLKEPFGDPFSGEDLKAQLGGGDDSEDSDSEDESMLNQDDVGVNSSSIKGKKRNSLPFYSDGEEDDTDNEDINEKSKSQKHDLKKHKSQKSSSSDVQMQLAANGGSLSLKSPPATATKTVPPSVLSSTSIIQSSTLISPRNSGSNNDKKEEKLTKDKKISKKKQKELHQQQQLLLAEATAKANANISDSGIDVEKSEELVNGTSLKKKRGRPKKNRTEEPQEQGKNVSAGNSPTPASQQPLVSSQVSLLNF